MIVYEIFVNLEDKLLVLTDEGFKERHKHDARNFDNLAEAEYWFSQIDRDYIVNSGFTNLDEVRVSLKELKLNNQGEPSHYATLMDKVIEVSFYQ